MWHFTGDIEYTCDKCSETDSIPIEDFDHDFMGSERSMGYEEIHVLTYQCSCYECSNDIELKFEVSEYPTGIINFTIDKCEGANASNEPDTEDVREIYSARDLFDLYESISELVTSLQHQPELLSKLDPRQFEEVTAEIFRDKGFEVELTKRTRDGGKDIIALNKDNLGFKTKYLIECKHYAENNKVGVDVVRSLYGVKNSRNGGNLGIIVTTSTFTSGARKFLDNEAQTSLDLSLADKNTILEWLADYNKS